VFHYAAEAFYSDPAVINPLLKFIAELVYNKSGRITFDISSVNGILLFKETSKLLVTYGINNIGANFTIDTFNIGARILNYVPTRDSYFEK
jgi:hypothetical protein